MKKTALLLVPLLILALGAAWWLQREGRLDRFDYEAAFERPAEAAAAGAAKLDLAAFAGKPRDVVREVLGEPERCEPALHSERCRYPVARVEITFIDGLADWITVPLRYGDAPFDAAILARYGLPSREPDELDEHQNVWRDLGGYREVRLVGSDSGALFLRIKVKTA